MYSRSPESPCDRDLLKPCQWDRRQGMASRWEFRTPLASPRSVPLRASVSSSLSEGAKLGDL